MTTTIEMGGDLDVSQFNQYVRVDCLIENCKGETVNGRGVIIEPCKKCMEREQMTTTINYDLEASNSSQLCRIDTSKIYDGDCIKKNTQKYLELVERFGWENFRLVTMATTIDKSSDYVNENHRINGEYGYFKNYQFHLVIGNIKQKKMIDVSNGRLIIMPWQKYYTLYKTENKGESGAYEIPKIKLVAEKGVEFGITKEQAIKAYVSSIWETFDKKGLPNV